MRATLTSPARSERRALGLALGAATVLMASGCRIPPSGVIQAGEPANGLRALVTLYWVDNGSAERGALHPVSRPSDGVAGVAAAVAALAAGPTESEWQSGLATRLPFPMAAPRVTAEDGAVTIQLQPGFPRLTGTAMDQLACTATAAWRGGGQAADGADVQVTVSSPPAKDTGTEAEAGRAATAKASGWRVRWHGADCPSGPAPTRADPAPAPPAGGTAGGVGGGGDGVVPSTAHPAG